MKRMLFVTIAAAAALSAGACENAGGPGGDGVTRILLTDAPFPFDAVGSVEVHIVSVAVSETADTTRQTEDGWQVVADPDRTFDLLTLQGGATAVVGETELRAGDYAAVRMVIDASRSRITWADGSEAKVQWQGEGLQTLFALVEEPLGVPSDGGRIVIDFDVGRSFLAGVAAPGFDFVFIPWIRAVDEAETGSLSGTVRGPSIEGAAVPLANASVTVFHGDPDQPSATWWVAATGRTGADGTYMVSFLRPDTYILQVDPPSDVVLARATVPNVTIAVGQETVRDVQLTRDGGGVGGGGALVIGGKTNLAVGEQAAFLAQLFSASGDSLSPGQVAWATSNAAVASVTLPDGAASTQVAWVTGKAVGTAVISAQSGDLADSVTVVVGQGGGGSDAPVATVELSPTSQTVSTGDSLGIVATLRDAEGHMLTGRTVEWSTSNASIVSITGAFGVYAIFKAEGTGTATITAASEGKEGSATVVVK